MPESRGINKDAHLIRSVLEAESLKRVPTRNGFGEGLLEAGKKDPRVVVLCADLTESTRCQAFKDTFPDRFIQMGVSEQAMASIAAGLALAGKVPFIASYAAFSPGRNWEQIKTTICINEANVKIAGAHAGVSVGPDGATHQMLEDIALMRVLPGMTVIVPCDVTETKKATLAVAGTKTAAYLRFTRDASPVFTTEKTPFKIGRAETYRFGGDVTIFGAGPILYDCLLAAEILSEKHGIEARVVNLHTIKPLDVKAIVAAAKETGAIVTAEEAQTIGGLGGAVAETLSTFAPCPLERVGMEDRYGESGTPLELLNLFRLNTAGVIDAVKRVVARKEGRRLK